MLGYPRIISVPPWTVRSGAKASAGALALDLMLNCNGIAIHFVDDVLRQGHEMNINEYRGYVVLHMKLRVFEKNFVTRVNGCR